MLREAAERALQKGLPLLDPRVPYRELEVKSLAYEKLLLSGGNAVVHAF